MRGIGRKFRRIITQLRQVRPGRKIPSVAPADAAGSDTADFVVLCAPEIRPDEPALRSIARFLALHGEAAAAYTDETHFYKPDWSPELLRSTPYPGPLCIIRPALLQKLGGAPQVPDEAGFYDFWLRIAEEAVPVAHVPEALFTRPRPDPGQTAACRSALQQHADRVFGTGTCDIYPTPLAAAWPISFAFFHKRSDNPLISLIIPTKDGLELLEPCVRSILEISTHGTLEIVIVNNNSTQAETLAYFRRIQNGGLPRCRVVDAPFPINWSRVNNVGAAVAQGDVLVFMNNDMEVITPDWLEWLSGYALRPEIGVVGARLLREDSTLQHAGIVLGLGGWCDHIFDYQQPDLTETEFVPPALIRNVSAVTGACMAISAEKFFCCGSFDEAYQVTGSDVEYCLRMMKAGLRNVYLAPACLYHLESRTRSTGGPDPDRQRFRRLISPFRWQGDPFFNANLSLFDNCGKMRSRWE